LLSNRGRKAVIVGLVVFAAAGVLIDRSRIAELYRPVPTSDTALVADIDKYHEKTSTVINVVDGDTIDIDIPDGQYDRTRIRLLGIDTPELHGEKVEYFGLEASLEAERLCMNKEVMVLLDLERSRCHYGRLLAYVKLPGEKILNEEMIKSGHAYADLRFEHPEYEKYKQLQKTARQQKKGLWEEVRQEQLPDWLRRKRPDMNLGN